MSVCCKRYWMYKSLQVQKLCKHHAGSRRPSNTNEAKEKKERISFFLQKEKRKGVYGRPKSIYISSGTWRNLETFCVVCREVLLSHSISENPGNLKLLYNFVAQSDSVKAMLLPIIFKSTAQIAAKIAYLSKFHEF